MPANFGDALRQRFDRYGQLCVGIDPHAAILADWGLDDTVAGLERFAMEVLDASAERVGVIKPQVAFFERFGSAGLAVLERLASKAQQTDLLVIMDAKRGDIGSTMQGYFDAWLSKEAPFACDALTLSPYLGLHSLDDVLSVCSELGKGVFVLAATSNPEATELQQARLGETTVAADVLKGLNSANRIQLSPGGRLGPFGAVIGATVDLFESELAPILNADSYVTPILAPGFGYQGARLEGINSIFGSSSAAVLASVSRSVLGAGASGIRHAIDAAKQELATGLSKGVQDA